MSEGSGDNVLFVKFKEKSAVYNCYMAFFKDGGLFVPEKVKVGNHPYAHLGAPVFLLVELPESTTVFPVSGRVGWINFGKRSGVGVRLSNDEWGRKLHAAIENLLAGSLRSNNPTFTL